eukprot:CAMPEP_0172163498 /NCGR_PEP_ID=MMETSP1050-20130122/7305_1 /TAXON_ID=233186 /ORGANISM="Cryptomonas curvata, Strain CCAP979/52" /LENGTH=191 /DNA_ID=CAMNT_0012833695 /DNA_START=89 /DNA_END=664 /DNA_ORIENTATION=+
MAGLSCATGISRSPSTNIGFGKFGNLGRGKAQTSEVISQADLQERDWQEISEQSMSALVFEAIPTLVVWTIIYLQLDGLVKNIVGFNKELEKMLNGSKDEVIMRESKASKEVDDLEAQSTPLREEATQPDIAPSEPDNESIVRCIQTQATQIKNLIKVCAIVCIGASALLNIVTRDAISEAQRVEKLKPRQ